MIQPKVSQSKNNLAMHYSVGAVIKIKNKYLLIDRAVIPFGFAGIAGHVDEGETPEQAIIREVKEECGLTVKKLKLLFEEEIDWNTCSRGVTVHYWYVYDCETEGEISRDLRETKSIGFYSADEIKNLKLEPVWKYWFRKLSVIS